MQITAILVMLAFAIGAITLSWLYFRRYQVNRPPIGVINLYDIGLMIGGIIVMPYLYLWISPWLVVGLLALGALSLLSLGLEPLVRSAWMGWAVSLALIGSDIAAAALWTTRSPAFMLINNLVMLLIVVSISNLWAQSGLKARDITLLGVALILYDLIATSYLPLMGDLFQRMMALPMGTQFAWRVGETGMAAIGIGDVLMAAVFPLVMRRAFGVGAGLIAIIGSFVVLVGLPLLPLTSIFPVMVVLGPLMVVQYLGWRYQRRAERTTWHYLQAEPIQAMK